MPDIRTKAREEVALLNQRHEVQSELQCRGLDADSRIGNATGHAQRHGDVSMLGVP